jgi:outer membrane biogenesis lipoprotein LolB
MVDRHRARIALAAVALLASCGAPQRHNSAENEFNAWAGQQERAQANGQSVDFDEPVNVMDRVVPANAH